MYLTALQMDTKIITYSVLFLINNMHCELLKRANWSIKMVCMISCKKKSDVWRKKANKTRKTF